MLQNKGEDVILSRLMGSVCDQELFVSMMTNCLEEIVAVIERQYSKYFDGVLDAELVESTKSARCQQ